MSKKQIKKQIKAAIEVQSELLFSIDGGPRGFFMSNFSMKTVLGIVVSETEDSFLVAMPAILMENEKGDKDVQPFIPAPYFRLQKSSVIFVSYLFEPFNDAYKKYVKKFGPDMFPEYQYFLDNWKDETPQAYPEVGLATTEGAVKSGMTDEELREYLESRGQ